LPESVFDTTENKYISLFIYKYFKVRAVVSLLQLTFEPFTSTKTSLLFAQKKTKAQITPHQEVINKVFAREFGFDLEKFRESDKLISHSSNKYNFYS
jgi:hypothetical protein